MEAVALSRQAELRRLRVGVFADASLQPRWIVEAFARLAAADFVELVLVEPGRAPAADAAGLASAFAQLAAVESVPASLAGRDTALPLLWELYSRVDRRLFGPGEDELDLRACLPAGSGAGLDVAFALGAIDDAALHGRARYGVWRFCFGVQRGHDERLAGEYEVARAEPLTVSGLLVRVSAQAPARLAYQSWSCTHPYSAARNRDHLHKTGEFVFRALRELHADGEAWLQSCRPIAAVPAPAAPRAVDALRIGAHMARRAAQKALTVEQWFLAFAFNRPLDAGLRGFTRVMPPRDRDWADPFPLEHGGRHYIFFEEVPFATRKGHIAVIEVQRDGRWSAPVRVLERDYHLSYPFVFAHEGALYMIPESSANRTVELWRCVDFPGKWRLERNLLEDVRLVDATLLRRAGRWWMFANCAAGASEAFDDELCLFSAERLQGGWQPHARNPLKSDPRGSRPAGRVFEENGILYRPAQICVPRYGAGLSIQRVVSLSATEYVERQVERIVPPPATGLLGLHTMNRAGDLLVVDAFARRRRF
jgi:hypothetical protein